MSKVYYIDDEDPQELNFYVEALNDLLLIPVELFDLKQNKDFSRVVDVLQNEWDEIDGFILDLRLNGTGPNHLNFSATSLAQWLRSYAVECNLMHKPIILLSNDFEGAKFYEDITSHDLFDITLSRSGNFDWKDLANKTKTLINGYKLLNNCHDLNELFQFDIDKNALYLTPFTIDKEFNASLFASLLLNDLFKYSGVFIDEYGIASKLGIDVEKSGESWNRFKVDIFSDQKYKGIFSELKELYWQKKVDEKIYSIIGRFSALNAKDRFKKLIEAGLNLEGIEIAEPIKYCCSSFFSTIDYITKKPLDSCEGYMLNEVNGLKSWQEPRFVSFETLEEGKMQNNEKLIPSEKQRFDEDMK